jgi:hypothetical protein
MGFICRDPQLIKFSCNNTHFVSYESSVVWWEINVARERENYKLNLYCAINVRSGLEVWNGCMETERNNG